VASFSRRHSQDTGNPLASARRTTMRRRRRRREIGAGNR
jgi:hypothetical protein